METEVHLTIHKQQNTLIFGVLKDILTYEVVMDELIAT
jgi:hypothetical protein